MSDNVSIFAEKFDAMKHIRLVLLTVVCTMMLSCSGTQCPGFPNAFMDYIPHQESETLCFVNISNDSIQWDCLSKHQLAPEYLTWDCKCECSARDAGLYITTSRGEKIGIWIQIDKDAYNPGSDNLLNSGAEIIETLGEHPGSEVLHCVTSPSFVITNDQDVQIIEQMDTLLFTTTDARIIDSICIVRGQGIVSFYRVDNMSRYHVLR